VTPWGRREMRVAVFVKNPKVTSAFGKMKRRREYNIKMYLKAMGWRGFTRRRRGTSGRLL